jgi:hypothetical protein
MVLLWLVLVALAFACGYVVAAWRLGGLALVAAPAPEVAPPLHDDDRAAPEPVRVRFEKDVSEDSPEWRAGMAEVGERLRAAGVKLVVFAHGSFVGDDPLAVARALEEGPLLPDLGKALRA